MITTKIYGGLEEQEDLVKDDNINVDNITGSAIDPKGYSKRKRKPFKMDNMQSLFVLNFLASKKRNEFLSTLERGTVKEQALKEATDISQGPDFMVLAKPEDPSLWTIFFCFA